LTGAVGIGDAFVVEAPQTKFARVGEDRIAYQVFGEGPVDLLWVIGTFETIDDRWEWPPYAHFLRRVGSFCRVITFDRRGSGASDRVSRGGLPIWEDWADDVRAVLDAAGSERAAVFGSTDACAIALLFAATEPERTESLVLYCASARVAAAVDYPCGVPQDRVDQAIAYLTEMWGTEEMAAFVSQKSAQDAAFRRWCARMMRAASTPRDIGPTMRTVSAADVRHVLPSVRTPTLLIHRREYPWAPMDQARYLADHLPHARLFVIDGDAAIHFEEPGVEATLQEMETFLTGTPAQVVSADRVLVAVLYTDIVGSTERAAALGDRRWKSLLQSHDAIARGLVEQWQGRLVKMTGDGMVATFDGPGRAVQCAVSLREALRTLSIEIRAGLHTGEIEVRGDDISGIGVHVAARVMEHARPGEILVSGAVPLLMAGSGVEFEARGQRVLKGVPGEWPLLELKGL
jgi:class 3 adenylate cyclase